jgi:site-specific recombinase XerD
MTDESSSSTVPDDRLNTAHVESFIVSLKASGYALCKLRDKCRITHEFVAWTSEMQIPAREVDESRVTQFLEPQEGRGSKERLAFKHVLLRAFLQYLRSAGVVSDREKSIEETPARRLEREYADYLRDERGLSFRSLLVYLPHVRALLATQVDDAGNVSPESLSAQSVRRFVMDRSRERSGGYALLLAVALRSFLRFLFLRGKTQIDLSFSITRVRTPQGATPHKFLPRTELSRILSTPDLRTATGLRDHAILLLLARLGLRAGEVVALELDDIGWRTGELLVRGKGRVHDRLPLLQDVGAALATYIQSARGKSDCRRVFLRRKAPRVGLGGPSAIDCVVRSAFGRAGVERPPGVAAHVLRHSLATEMIRHGASLAEISEVLRHRSVVATEIYAQVAFEALREVALPWPGGEVVR